MSPDNDSRAAAAMRYFQDLQERLCERLETLEPGAKFSATRWSKPAEHRLKGGGQMRVLRAGVLEKAGVNVSHVWGQLSEAGRAQLPGASASGDFEACGISVVVHPRNPFAPIAHMNLRYLRTSFQWLGGGADLTPAIEIEEDTRDFHDALRGACAGYRAGAYEQYRDWCDRYFYLPHRNERRGVGGVFFDDLRSGDPDADFAFARAVGEAFLDVYPRILARRSTTPYGPAEVARQLLKRSRYVEFNLVYDRGTRFGFMTDADPEAYLMSLPPQAGW